MRCFAARYSPIKARPAHCHLLYLLVSKEGHVQIREQLYQNVWEGILWG